jgi:hypothetical protein
MTFADFDDILCALNGTHEQARKAATLMKRLLAKLPPADFAIAPLDGTALLVRDPAGQPVYVLDEEHEEGVLLSEEWQRAMK